MNLYGLELYNLYQSIEHILAYLDQKNPPLAQIARQQYKCLLTWRKYPAHYVWAALLGQTKECEEEAVSMLIQLLENYAANERPNEEEFLPIFQNALSITNAEEIIGVFINQGWLLGILGIGIRDRHMFETLETLMSLQDAKVVIWVHNSHVGNTAATDFYERGQFNLGQLCKEKYGEKAYLIGFGMHKGIVAAASSWGGEMQIKEVKDSHPQSIERLFHDTQVPSFFLPLQERPKRL